MLVDLGEEVREWEGSITGECPHTADGRDLGSDAAGDSGDEDDETAGEGGSGVLEGDLHDGRHGEIGFRGCHDGVQVACCVEQGDEEAKTPEGC